MWVIPTTPAIQVSRRDPLPKAASPTNSPAPPTYTFTPPPATATPIPTFTQTPTVIPATLGPTSTTLPASLQENIFEKLWKIVDEEYLYPDFNGLDWNAVHGEYLQKIEGGLNNDEFYADMEEMISRLGDDHSRFLSPAQVAEEDAELSGENDYVGIGILSSPVIERKYITIILVFPNSPAEDAGLQSHDNILAVDGQPIMDENGFRRQLLRGPEGSTVALTVQTPGQNPRQVQLTRQRVTGSVPVPYESLVTPGGKRIGYILLATFADDTVDDQVGQALRALSAEGKLDGIILDNRENSGGTSAVAKGVLGYFTSGVAGHFISRREGSTAFNILGADINGSSTVPLVVLVGQDSVSFGEIFSGILQDIGRAYVIGKTTDGNVELLWGYDFEDGSRAWIAHDRFQPLNHPDQNWELTGIIPDQTVLSNWDEVTLQSDPVIQAALEHFDGN
jgi:carboxyl-terminal processing protease